MAGFQEATELESGMAQRLDTLEARARELGDETPLELLNAARSDHRRFASALDARDASYAELGEQANTSRARLSNRISDLEAAQKQARNTKNPCRHRHLLGHSSRRSDETEALE